MDFNSNFDLNKFIFCCKCLLIPRLSELKRRNIIFYRSYLKYPKKMYLICTFKLILLIYKRAITLEK